MHSLAPNQFRVAMNNRNAWWVNRFLSAMRRAVAPSVLAVVFASFAAPSAAADFSASRADGPVDIELTGEICAGGSAHLAIRHNRRTDHQDYGCWGLLDDGQVQVSWGKAGETFAQTDFLSKGSWPAMRARLVPDAEARWYAYTIDPRRRCKTLQETVDGGGFGGFPPDGDPEEFASYFGRLLHAHTKMTARDGKNAFIEFRRPIGTFTMALLFGKSHCEATAKSLEAVR